MPAGPVVPSPGATIFVEPQDGFGPREFQGGAPLTGACDQSAVPEYIFGASNTDICVMMRQAAKNFPAVGASSGSFAILTVGVTRHSVDGVLYYAKEPARKAKATIAVIGQGFNELHPSIRRLFRNDYNFVASDTITIDAANLDRYRQVSQDNVATANRFPSAYSLVTAGLAAADANALERSFDNNFRFMTHGTEVAGVIAGRRVAITLLASGVYRNQVIESVPGLAPEAAILPINVAGAISLNRCENSCSRSRPEFITDANFAPRLAKAIELAQQPGNDVFAATFAVAPKLLAGIPGVQVTIVNAGEFMITLNRASGSSALPDTIVTTFASGALTIVRVVQPRAPGFLESGDTSRPPMSPWPQATRDAITSDDGMALVFAVGNDGTNAQNGNFYERASFAQLPVSLTISGTVHDGSYRGDVGVAVKFTIANEPDNNANRAFPHYLSYLWRFSGQQYLRPYFLAVAGSRNINNGTGTTVEIDPQSNGCAFAQERCLTAPGWHVVPVSDRIDEEKANFGYFFDTSYAAGFVAGALALLKGYFPELSAAAATEILLATADPAGDPAVYGRGHLNVAKAMSPVGELTSNRLGQGPPLAGSRLHFSAPLAALSQAAGDVTGYDSFSRPFQIPLAGLIASQPHRYTDLAGQAIWRRQRHSASDAYWNWQHSLGRIEQIALQPLPGWQLSHDLCAPECVDQSGFMAGNLELANVTRLSREVLSDGALTWQASTASGLASRARFWQLALRSSRQPVAGVELAVEAGLTAERDTLLGSQFDGAFALRQGARARFVHVAAQVSLSHNTDVHASYAQAQVSAAGLSEGLVADISGLRADSLRLGVRRGNLLRRNDSLELEWKLPLAATGGRLSLRTGGYDADGVWRIGTTDIDLRSSHRPRSWGVSYTMPVAMLGWRGWLAAGLGHRSADFASERDGRTYSASVSLQL